MSNKIGTLINNTLNLVHGNKIAKGNSLKELKEELEERKIKKDKIYFDSL